MTAELIVVPLRHGPFWNFSYLLGHPLTGEAAVIDPAWDVPGIVAAASERGLTIETIILTHSHSDHAHGVAELVGLTGATVVAHARELPGVSKSYRGYVLGVTGEQWALGDIPMRLIHTPGHTRGSLSILVEGRLFTGDTLNVGSIGSPGTEAGLIEALWKTVQEPLKALPDDTTIHPGHDAGPSPSSTLGAERARIGALSVESFPAFVREVERTTGLRFSSNDEQGIKR